MTGAIPCDKVRQHNKCLGYSITIYMLDVDTIMIRLINYWKWQENKLHTHKHTHTHTHMRMFALTHTDTHLHRHTHTQTHTNTHTHTRTHTHTHAYTCIHTYKETQTQRVCACVIQFNIPINIISVISWRCLLVTDIVLQHLIAIFQARWYCFQPGHILLSTVGKQTTFPLQLV